MIQLRSEIGIGIATRDRWEDLSKTLAQLSGELRACEILVMDDGSETPPPVELRERFPTVRFERSERSLGVVAQRNRLAGMLRAPFYLSLDDDSYPETGDLGAAVRWLIDHPEVIALGFYVREGSAPRLAEVDPAAPYPVRFFIGCACLLRREAFLRLGGYREELEYYCEEFEFALRAWKHGAATYAYPGLVIRHNRSLEGRNVARINRMLTRNDLWIAAWHYPLLFLLLSYVNALPRVLRNRVHRRYWRAVLQGFWSALTGLPKILLKRAPLSWPQQLAWRRLPHGIVLITEA